MRGRGDGGDVLHVEGLRSRRLDQYRARVGADQGADAGADGGVVIGRLDAHPPEHRVAIMARRLIGGVGDEEVIAGADGGRDRGDDRKKPGGDQHGPGGAGKRTPGFAKSVGGRRAVGAVGVALLAGPHRLDVGIENRRAAIGGHIDEAMARLGVAAEMHEARTRAEPLLCFFSQFRHF